ncbi:hypothetical protein OIO90_003334 [Microbotryomycetes sp. JL221]|nr:hypothetical protein OIO90_003334 [Microbotryomycetes sp. JL221]
MSILTLEPKLDRLFSTQTFIVDWAVASLLALVVYCAYQFWFSPLADIPGPLSCRLGLYGWQTMRAIKLDIGPQLKAWHDKTGSPLIRISANELSCSDPAAIPYLYKKHDDHQDGKLFSKKNLLELEPVFDKVIDSFKFGQSFGVLETNTDPENILDRIDLAVYGITVGGVHPKVAPALLKFARRFNLGDVNFVRNRATKCLDASIERFEADGKQSSDLMSKMLTLDHYSGRKYDREEIEGMASVFFAAGSDTTAIVLRSFIYYMIRFPEVCQQLIQELTFARESSTLSIPPTYEETLRLPFFQACLWETIRIHPSVHWILPRVVPNEGLVLPLSNLSRYLSKGQEIGLSAYVVQRDIETFGKDANQFRPARWIQDVEQGLLNKNLMMSRILTFGSGSRVCLGKQLALMIVSKVLPELVLDFEFKVCPRGQKTSPHLYKMGKSQEGIESVDEPWVSTSGFLGAQFDMWLNVNHRVQDLD